MKIALDAAQVHAGRGQPAAQGDGDLPLARATSSVLAGQDGRADGRARLRPRFRAALLRPDQGLRRIWLPRKPRGELRAPRLRVELAEVEISGGLRLRAAQLAADGLLRAGADRPRRARAWRRGARGRCESQRLGLHAGGRRARASACARSTGLQREAADAAGRARGPMRTVEELRSRAAACRCMRSSGSPRPTRSGRWGSTGARRCGIRGRSRQAPDLPLFAYAEARDEGTEAEPAQLPAMPLAEHVVNDYQTIRLSLKAHPMRFLREHYAAQKFVTADQLQDRSGTASACRSPGWC